MKTCAVCGGDLGPGNPRRVYCGPRCRKRAELDARAATRGAPFADVVVDEHPSREQLLQLAMVAARAGSVAAMRLLLEERRRDGDVTTPLSFIDELGKRRHGA